MFKQYDEIILQYILNRAGGVLKPPTGDLKYPYIDPGAGYGGELWDWDSYFTARALCRACNVLPAERVDKAGLSRERIVEHIKGCVLNFLAAQERDGYVPIMVAAGGLFEGYFHAEHQKGVPLNQHKPFLCQAALQACKFTDDFDWLDENRLIAYMRYYEQNQYDKNSGLFVWLDDVMIGIDNNPTVFFRPLRSCADVYLNSFMCVEYIALSEILRAKNKIAEAELAEKSAARLKDAINAEMWDERDGLYYSQDVGFYAAKRKIGDFEFHAGLAPSWRALPLKIRFWGCFLPLYAGICPPDRAQRVCKHLDDRNVMSDFGLRTLAADEKMYNLEKSSNPSKWLGAIWTVPNYLIYTGLLRYGFADRAENLRRAALRVIGENIEKSGDMYESYNPENGEPNLHPGFLSWNLLAIEMLDCTQTNKK